MDALDFDNVPFMLNCVDVLTGDESFIPLRPAPGPAPHAHGRGGAVARLHQEGRGGDARGRREGQGRPPRRAARLDKQIEDIRANKELDERTKETTVRFRQQVETQKLEVAKAEIEDEKRRKIEDARVDREEAIQRIQNRIRAAALILPPLPALLLGGLIFFSRARDEKPGREPQPPGLNRVSCNRSIAQTCRIGANRS